MHDPDARYELDPAAPKAVRYAELSGRVRALVEGEPDAIANLANVAAELNAWLPDLNWVGFYLVKDGELVVGPFQGRPACTRIALGRGVCGTAAARGATQLVPDVEAFPGHIACDARSRSEIVVPIAHDGAVVAVLDLDSPRPARFDDEDRAGLEAVVAAFSPVIDWGRAARS
jgi:L-methionine (R)-S-oxide reductase